MPTALSGFPTSNHSIARRCHPIILIAAATALTVYTAAIFVFGQMVSDRDVRLFRSHDSARIDMISRACGKHGVLWQRPGGDQFACVYTSGEAQPLFEPIPAAVLIAGWR